MCRLSSSPCEASSNPRLDGCCFRCGQPVPDGPAGPDPDPFLADVEQLVKLIRGMSFDPAALALYTQKVYARLAEGEKLYGHAYLERDNLFEAGQEPPDTANYAMLELARLLHLGATPDDLAEIRVDLVSAAAHAAISDQFLRAAKLKRAELGF